MHKLSRFQNFIKDFFQRVSTNKTASSTRIDDQAVVVNALNESIDAMSISVGKGTIKAAEEDVLWQRWRRLVVVVVGRSFVRCL